MQKSRIEWTDYTLNPIKGLCPVDCKDNQGKSYCYARRMYKRFKWNPEIRYIDPGFTIAELQTIKKPSRIFWGSTFELFHDDVLGLWLQDTFKIVRQFPQHTHFFLTKQPQNLAKFSPFPQNCWAGVSVCNDKMLDAGVDKLEDIQAEIKFISFEPLLEKLTLSLDYAFYYSGISWVIIGSQTQPIRHPDKAWVTEIIDAADRAHIPVFIKPPLSEYMGIERKEMPEE